MASNPKLQQRDLSIVLYCKTSGRAALCAQSLANMGYTDIQSIAGGIDAWLAAGHEVFKPVQPSFD
jgi:rhodanese-related sulfurtransferase